MGDVTVGAQSGKDGAEGPQEPSGRHSGEPRPTGPPEQAADGTHPAGGADTTPPSAADGRADSAPASDEERHTPTTGDAREEGDRRSGGRSPGPGKRRKRRKQRPFWKELPLLIVIALGLALLFKTFLVQAFSIPSDSMQNTLQRGDRVLVDKLTPWFGAEPERGEVVVFHDPGGWLGESPGGEPSGFGGAVQEALSFIGLMPSAKDNDLIKRVIAVGGDTVECERGGVVQVNGTPLDESEYLYPGNTSCGDNPFGPIKVPEGRIWVMGDHRQASLDSRYHQNLPGGGTVATEDVVGRAIVIAWPPTRWDGLSVPESFERSNLAAATAAGAPALLGAVGVLPLAVWRRRRRRRGRAG